MPKNTMRNKQAEAERLFLEGSRLDDQRKYSKAIVPLLSSAMLGHAWSQLEVGNYYASGSGVRKNLAEAAKWYKRAYKNKHPPGARESAALNLAIDLRRAGNLRSAVVWYKKAVALKEGTAYVELAEIYLSRKGGKNKAVALLKSVLRLSDEFASELDKDEARALLQEISE